MDRLADMVAGQSGQAAGGRVEFADAQIAIDGDDPVLDAAENRFQVQPIIFLLLSRELKVNAIRLTRSRMLRVIGFGNVVVGTQANRLGGALDIGRTGNQNDRGKNAASFYLPQQIQPGRASQQDIGKNQIELRHVPERRALPRSRRRNVTAYPSASERPRM